MKLNIGCGEKKLEGCINIDSEPSTTPDLLCDITKECLPYEPFTVDEIYCIHNIEHIPIIHWIRVFGEFHRVLKADGLLVLAYPEFEICVKHYLENHHGDKAFWRATLYGRQLYPGDYHVTPVQTSELTEFLHQFGFNQIKSQPDDAAPYYTFLTCHKSVRITREDVLKKEIFGEIHRVDNRFVLK